MNYFEAPQDYSGDNGLKLFLAGGIGNCVDWQQEMVGMLSHNEVTILNPRRVHFQAPWTRQASREQIAWERNALVAADIIVFWFAGGPSAQPIALLELGMWANQSVTPIVVGRDPSYTRLDDIEIQLELLRGKNFPIYTSLAATADAAELAIVRHPKNSQRWY